MVLSAETYSIGAGDHMGELGGYSRDQRGEVVTALAFHAQELDATRHHPPAAGFIRLSRIAIVGGCQLMLIPGPGRGNW